MAIRRVYDTGVYFQICTGVMVITRITNCKTDPLNSGCLVVVIVAVLVVVLR